MRPCNIKASGFRPLASRKLLLLRRSDRSNRDEMGAVHSPAGRVLQATNRRAVALADQLYRFCMLFACSTIVPAATDILVLQSHDSQPYQQAVAGFQSGLANSKLDAAYQTVTLPSQSDANELNQLLKDDNPTLILALGTPATRAALAEIKKTPIVAGLVLDTDELQRTPNSTGVGLNFPASLHWLWLRRLLPEAHQIAVLYDPQQGLALFHALQKQAQTEGIKLIEFPASNAEDFPSIIQNLPQQLDALWAVDGASAYNSAAVRELLLYSFRNRVPLIGLSAQWVKAGALYALDWDYNDLGAQASDLARDILLKGIPPASLPPLTPRKVRPVLNSKTAEHMKLQISDRWLPEMSEVFQ